MAKVKMIGRLFCIPALLTFIISCASGASTNVTVWRNKYNPNVVPSISELYKGHKVFLASVVDETKDTTNFYYYSPDRSVAYGFYYDEKSWQQPLASFFWYAYQKTLQSVGIIVEENNPSKDSPELLITFKSFQSDRLVYQVFLVSKTKGTNFYKEYTVTMPSLTANDTAALEKAAYEMIDKTIYAFLSDPEFQKVFLQKENTIPEITTQGETPQTLNIEPKVEQKEESHPK